ncbi:MAG: LCP family protein, partial [Clostridia bacterium]|nr:LCP family protein [Clostridia bacterium]
MERPENEQLSTNTPVENKKKKRTVRHILLVILLILVALFAALTIAVFSIPKAIIDSNIQHTSELSESEVAVTPDLPPVHEVQNIMLFGIDQASGTVGRSDAMILLSIDKVNNKIKMTSLSRDSLVPIDGHGQEKLTHAWAYGHAKLAVKTINQNFGMNITDY